MWSVWLYSVSYWSYRQVVAICWKNFEKFWRQYFSNTFWHARAEILVTMLLQTEVLWDMVPYRLISVYRTALSRNSDGLCYLHARIAVREVNWAALSVFADEPAVQGVRGASGRLPFWGLHVRGMQGEIAWRQLEVWDCALGHSQDLFQAGGKQRTEMFVKEAFNVSKPQWLLNVPPGLTFNNSTFWPHSAFVSYVWIWEQTAIISLYSINWLVFITKTENVYSAVRTGSLNMILVNRRF